MKEPRLPERRWLKVTLIAAGLMLLLPGLQVALVRLIDPPLTTPMILRSIGGMVGPDSRTPNSYHWVAIEDVPADFLKFAWVAEDRHFFKHAGFDWQAIQHARDVARKTGRPAHGASTITQQCARSLFLWQNRSWLRKGLEAYYTGWMELLLSKKRILELYVNVAEFGDGIYGVDAAAQHYYGVPAEKMTDAQAALLVAVLPNPKNLNPGRPGGQLLAREAVILDRSKSYVLPMDRLQ